MKSFNATIVYTNTAHDDDPRCKQSLYPNVNEYNDITMLRSKIIDLQYFLYRPDYILVEFQGTIYNASGYGTQSQRRDNIALYNAMHEYKRKQDKANEMIK